VLWHCWLGHLIRKNPSPIWPIVFGGTLSLNQSINQFHRGFPWNFVYLLATYIHTYILILIDLPEYLLKFKNGVNCSRKYLHLNHHFRFHTASENDKKLRHRRVSAGLRLLCRSRSFEVTDFGTNRKPGCDFLLANNTYILSRNICKISRSIVQVIAVDMGYFSNTLGLNS